jgi:hypothetical protein
MSGISKNAFFKDKERLPPFYRKTMYLIIRRIKGLGNRKNNESKRGIKKQGR